MSTETRQTTISQARLRALLASVKGATFVGFTSFTTPEGRKTPFGPIRKVCKVSGVTGGYYDRALAKVGGGAASEERAWGEHGEHSALVTKVHPETGATTYYLPIQNPKVGKALYLATNQRGRLAAVPTDQVMPYLRQRPEQIVPYRDYRLDHVCSVNLGGRRYRIRPEPVTP